MQYIKTLIKNLIKLGKKERDVVYASYNGRLYIYSISSGQVVSVKV